MYHIASLSAANLHFLTGVFFHFITGADSNYQVLIPDIFALAESAFGMPVKGLLNQKEVYNKFWIDKNAKQLDLIRFPHISREHCLADVVDAASQGWEEINRWYQYQDVGYITSIYDSFAMRLGGADYDNDHIYGIADNTLLAAVSRQEANTIWFERDPNETDNNQKVMANDYISMAKSDSIGFANAIGPVVNKTSALWSMITLDNPENEKILNYIKALSVVDSLTIDFVKTGIPAGIPKEIKKILSKYKKPYFMQFRSEKEYQNAISVDRNIKAKEKLEKTENKGLALYNNNPSTMNRIAHYMDSKISNLSGQYNVSKFEWTKLLSGKYDPQDSKIYTNIRRKLLYLNSQFNFLRNDEYGSFEYDLDFDIKDCKNVNYWRLRLFFDDAKNQLLMEQPDIDMLINDLIICYYNDTKFSQIRNRSILWNCFYSQMLLRIQGKKPKSKIYNLEELKKQHEKILKQQKEARRKYTNKKNIPFIDAIDLKVSITDADKKYINQKLNTQKSKKLYYALLYIYLKINAEQEKEKWIKIGTKKKDNQISKSMIKQLCGLQKRGFEDAMQSCCNEEHPMIIVDFHNIKVPKIKVLYERNEGKEIELPNTCKAMRSWINRYVPAQRNEKYDFMENSNKKVKREDHKNNKAVVRLEDKQVFPSITIAAEQSGLSANNISACCLDRNRHTVCGGYHWKYLKEIENLNNL